MGGDSQRKRRRKRIGEERVEGGGGYNKRVTVVGSHGGYQSKFEEPRSERERRKTFGTTCLPNYCVPEINLTV